MIGKKGPAIWAMVIALILSVSAWAAGQRRNQQQQQQQQQQAQGQGQQLVAKAEADSKLSDKERDAIKKKDKNAVFIDKNSPQYQAFMNQTDQRILAYYQSIIQSYQMLNDAPKMLQWGEKALGYKPD